MWDDLADRGRDRIEHPGRVLVRDAEGTQIVALVRCSRRAEYLPRDMAGPSGIAVGVLAVLTAALGVWYLARTRRSVAGEQLLLAKYPAMVGIVAGSRVLEAPVQILSVATAALSHRVRLRGMARPRQSACPACWRTFMNVIDAVVDRESYAGLETTSGQSVGRPADFFERVPCYLCGATEHARS